MTIEEFGTIMEQRTPVKIILLNNNYLGNVRQWQALFFRHRYSFTPMMNPNYEKIAEAYDIPVRTVTERADLESAIIEMLATPDPSSCRLRSWRKTTCCRCAAPDTMSTTCFSRFSNGKWVVRI